jgi:hypothetical protein
MVDWSNQREVVDFTKMVLQDLIRIESYLPLSVEEYYDRTEVTNEPNVTLERFQELLEALDARDSPVRLVGDGGDEVILTHNEISRTIRMLRDQNINPVE